MTAAQTKIAYTLAFEGIGDFRHIVHHKSALRERLANRKATLKRKATRLIYAEIDKLSLHDKQQIMAELLRLPGDIYLKWQEEVGIGRPGDWIDTILHGPIRVMPSALNVAIEIWHADPTPYTVEHALADPDFL